jgi:hypothetical protein
MEKKNTNKKGERRFILLSEAPRPCKQVTDSSQDSHAEVVQAYLHVIWQSSVDCMSSFCQSGTGVNFKATIQMNKKAKSVLNFWLRKNNSNELQ